MILLAVLVVPLKAAEPVAAVDMHKRAEELKSLKWGMFVCWSLSTFSGKEWTPGVKDVSFFKATSVDTDQWARTAKEAGMGYILFLTKHCDGFCLWDTKTTDRKVTNAPLGRDVLAEVKRSCDKYGIKLALYFIEGDWSWPGAKDGKARGSGLDAEKERAQLQELCTQYGPVEFFWIDAGIGKGGLTHAELVAWIKKFQPKCFVGSNNGPACEGFDLRAGECKTPGPVKDFLVGEFTYPIQPAHVGGAMWFYSLPKWDGLCCEARHLYWDYRNAVKCENIFSLDVGPDYEGKLREIDVRTLRQVGEWIRDPAKAPVEEPALSAGKPCKAWPDAPLAEGRGRVPPGNAVNGNYYDFWRCEEKEGWLEVDLEKEQQVGRLEICQTYYPGRIESFSVEYRDGATWKELARGTTIDGCKEIQCPSVTARFVRLNVKGIGKMCVAEFRVLPPKKN